MLMEFISTVYYLAKNGKWSELNLYFKLITEILNAPSVVMTAGTPINKEI